MPVSSSKGGLLLKFLAWLASSLASRVGWVGCTAHGELAKSGGRLQAAGGRWQVVAATGRWSSGGTCAWQHRSPRALQLSAAARRAWGRPSGRILPCSCAGGSAAPLKGAGAGVTGGGDAAAASPHHRWLARCSPEACMQALEQAAASARTPLQITRVASEIE
eukprot:353546-Chlamydomonas_euryale.AAC.5